MRKPEQTPEPSIEEILASIRRIIADDAAPVSLAEAEHRLDQPQLQPAERRPKLEELGPRSAANAGGEEILELTEDFMLAEETPVLELDEPQEPDAGSYRDTYDDSFTNAPYHDPYAEPATPPPLSQPAMPEPQQTSSSTLKSILSGVMAEVHRFAGGEPQAQSSAMPAEPSGKQQGEASVASQAGRPASRPVWSARHQQNDNVRGREQPAAYRSDRDEVPGFRKPESTSRDGWSRGVQMPVPENGPAMPFAPEPAFGEPRPLADASPAPASARAELGNRPIAETAARPSRESQATPMPAAGERRAMPESVQTRAEKLAEVAVSDFASQRLSVPPAADFLKADKPLMEEISNSLADALSKGPGANDTFANPAPPLDHVLDESFASIPPLPDSLSKRPIAPDIMNLDGAFVPSKPAFGMKQAGFSSQDQETPELPREDLDDIMPIVQAEKQLTPAYARPVGIAEPPIMPNVTVSPGRGTLPSASGPNTTPRDGLKTPERLQTSPSGPKTLEETIKEMLKPLLLQWLNENMPRIVNEAIREEIAAKGLLRTFGDERR